MKIVFTRTWHVKVYFLFTAKMTRHSLHYLYLYQQPRLAYTLNLQFPPFHFNCTNYKSEQCIVQIINHKPMNAEFIPVIYL